MQQQITSNAGKDDLPIRLYPSRWKTAILLIGSTGFLAIGVWTAINSTAKNTPFLFVFIISYIGIPFWSVCSVVATILLFDHRPVVDIGKETLRFRTGFFGLVEINQNEIDHVAFYSVSSQRFIGIVLFETEQIINRVPLPDRWFAWSNFRSGYPPISVPQSIINMPLEDLAQLIHERFGVPVENDLRRGRGMK